MADDKRIERVMQFYGAQRAGKSSTLAYWLVQARIEEDRRTYARWSRRAKLRTYGVTQGPLPLTRESRRPMKGSAWVPVRVPGHPKARLANERRAAHERRIWRRIYRGQARRESPPIPDRLPAMPMPPGYDHLYDAARYAIMGGVAPDQARRNFWFLAGMLPPKQIWINLGYVLAGSILGYLIATWYN